MPALQINKSVVNLFRDDADDAFWGIGCIANYLEALSKEEDEEMKADIREQLQFKYQNFSESIDNLIYLRSRVKEILLGESVDVTEDN